MADEKTETFNMRVSPGFLRMVDEWRRHQPDIPPRAVAIRRLVELGLQNQDQRESVENTASNMQTRIARLNEMIHQVAGAAPVDALAAVLERQAIELEAMASMSLATVHALPSAASAPVPVTDAMRRHWDEIERYSELASLAWRYGYGFSNAIVQIAHEVAINLPDQSAEQSWPEMEIRLRKAGFVPAAKAESEARLSPKKAKRTPGR